MEKIKVARCFQSWFIAWFAKHITVPPGEWGFGLQGRSHEVYGPGTIARFQNTWNNLLLSCLLLAVLPQSTLPGITQNKPRYLQGRPHCRGNVTASLFQFNTSKCRLSDRPPSRSRKPLRLAEKPRLTAEIGWQSPKVTLETFCSRLKTFLFNC